MPGAYLSQKRVLAHGPDTVKGLSLMYVGAENQTWLLYKSGQRSLPLSHLSNTNFYVVLNGRLP